MREDVSDSLLADVNKALAKEPTERFQNMAEMEATLRQVQVEKDGTHPALATTLVDVSELEGESLLAEEVTVGDSLTENEIAQVDIPQEGMKTP